MADLKLPRLNKIFVSGRITQELELKYTPKGTPVLRFTLANDKAFKDESGQWQTQAIYLEVVAWNNQAENLIKMAQKGTAVLVEGRLDARTYVDQNNQNRKIYEIVADHIQTLEWKPREDGVTEQDIPLPEEPQAAPAATKDDVPF